MSAKEAKARIKLNELLEECGWRFFDHATGLLKAYADQINIEELFG